MKLVKKFNVSKAVLFTLIAVAVFAFVFSGFIYGQSNTAAYADELGDLYFNGGSGTSSDPYKISTTSHFNNLQYVALSGTNYYYKQMNDLNFSGVTMPNMNFYGKYKGNLKTLSNITINSSANRNFGGMFTVNYGAIEWLTLNNVDIDISSGQYVGGITGRNYGSITGCIVNGSIIGTSSANIVGGIAGSNEEEASIGLLTTNNADVWAPYNVAGGIVCDNDGEIALVQNNGDVSAKNSGGICAKSYGTVQYGINYGTITGTESLAGGIVGINYNSISDCENYGSITCPLFVGGITGVNNGNSSLQTSTTSCTNYGIVNLTGNGYAGGIVGYNPGYYNTVSYCVAASGGNVAYVGPTSGSSTYQPKVGQIAGASLSSKIQNCTANNTVGYINLTTIQAIYVRNYQIGKLL